jgi:hypothetical protein
MANFKGDFMGNKDKATQRPGENMSFELDATEAENAIGANESYGFRS